MEQEEGRETGLFSLRLIPRCVRRSEGVLALTKPAAYQIRTSYLRLFDVTAPALHAHRDDNRDGLLAGHT